MGILDSIKNTLNSEKVSTPSSLAELQSQLTTPAEGYYNRVLQTFALETASDALDGENPTDNFMDDLVDIAVTEDNRGPFKRIRGVFTADNFKVAAGIELAKMFPGVKEWIGKFFGIEKMVEALRGRALRLMQGPLSIIDDLKSNLPPLLEGSISSIDSVESFLGGRSEEEVNGTFFEAKENGNLTDWWEEQFEAAGITLPTAISDLLIGNLVNGTEPENSEISTVDEATVNPVYGKMISLAEFKESRGYDELKDGMHNKFKLFIQENQYLVGSLGAVTAFSGLPFSLARLGGLSAIELSKSLMSIPMNPLESGLKLSALSAVIYAVGGKGIFDAANEAGETLVPADEKQFRRYLYDRLKQNTESLDPNLTEEDIEEALKYLEDPSLLKSITGRDFLTSLIYGRIDAIALTDNEVITSANKFNILHSKRTLRDFKLENGEHYEVSQIADLDRVIDLLEDLEVRSSNDQVLTITDWQLLESQVNGLFPGLSMTVNELSGQVDMIIIDPETELPYKDNVLQLGTFRRGTEPDAEFVERAREHRNLVIDFNVLEGLDEENSSFGEVVNAMTIRIVTRLREDFGDVLDGESPGAIRNFLLEKTADGNFGFVVKGGVVYLTNLGEGFVEKTLLGPVNMFRGIMGKFGAGGYEVEDFLYDYANGLVPVSVIAVTGAIATKGFNLRSMGTAILRTGGYPITGTLDIVMPLAKFGMRHGFFSPKFFDSIQSHGRSRINTPFWSAWNRGRIIFERIPFTGNEVTRDIRRAQANLIELRHLVHQHDYLDRESTRTRINEISIDQRINVDANALNFEGARIAIDERIKALADIARAGRTNPDLAKERLFELRATGPDMGRNPVVNSDEPDAARQTNAEVDPARNEIPAEQRFQQSLEYMRAENQALVDEFNRIDDLNSSDKNNALLDLSQERADRFNAQAQAVGIDAPNINNADHRSQVTQSLQNIDYSNVNRAVVIDDMDVRIGSMTYQYQTNPRQRSEIGQDLQNLVNQRNQMANAVEIDSLGNARIAQISLNLDSQRINMNGVDIDLTARSNASMDFGTRLRGADSWASLLIIIGTMAAVSVASAQQQE